MIILLDTNVVLDVLLDRDPFSTPASQLMSLVEKGEVVGFLCATTITTIHYLSTKVMGSTKAQNQIKDLMNLFEIASVNRTVIKDALNSKFSDFEDAVIYQAAKHAGAEAIITRNAKDFKRSELPIYDSEDILKVIQLLDTQPETE